MQNFEKMAENESASLKYKQMRDEYESECSILDRSGAWLFFNLLFLYLLDHIQLIV